MLFQSYRRFAAGIADIKILFLLPIGVIAGFLDARVQVTPAMEWTTPAGRACTQRRYLFEDNKR
jgi:hypothetical protein